MPDETPSAPDAGTPTPSPGCAAWALGALLLVLVVLGFVVWGCVSAVTDPPPEPTPGEVREQRQAEEDVKVYCGLWWDGLMELTDEQAQLCVDTGWGK